MASSSGSEDVAEQVKTLVESMYAVPSKVNATQEAVNIEKVPSCIASIAPILRVANEIEEENPRVAYLCRKHALQVAEKIDQCWSGLGVERFKADLKRRLKKEEEAKPMLTETDPGEIQRFYQEFCEDQKTRTPSKNIAKIRDTAAVLYDVLVAVLKPDHQIEIELERKIPQYEPFNILNLNDIRDQPASKAVKAAIDALRNVANLPKQEDNDKSVSDILDWLSTVFGFQKGNVANQREHLIFLLANLALRSENFRDHTSLGNGIVQPLMNKFFENYRSWCNYLHHDSNLKDDQDGNDPQQLELLYIGLYLLIWGEASNIRFMPECICCIFHMMAHEVNGILLRNVHPLSSGTNQRPRSRSFLDEMITPIYEVIHKEAERNKKGEPSHSTWRNYDDLNEYFWTKQCSELNWLDCCADFKGAGDATPNELTAGSCKPKTYFNAQCWKPKKNFVEVRTFWHLFRSFNRMWIFFILAFQAMVIIAWSPSRFAVFDEDVFKKLLSIFVTSAFLNFLQATLDIIFSWNAWRSLEFNQIFRYILKFAFAAVWVVVLPIGYSSSIQNPTGLMKFFRSWAADWRNQSFYNYCVVIYLIPNMLDTLLFFLPSLRSRMELSKRRIVHFLIWWAQPSLYVGRGMHEDMFSLFRYTLFWIALLISKLAFSYFVEILPLVEPTKLIMSMRIADYEWPEVFPNATHNVSAVIVIWAPIVLVYFMDAQIWYALFSTLSGGIYGAFSHLGEIRTLSMLWSRFQNVPKAFYKQLVPWSKTETKRNMCGPVNQGNTEDCVSWWDEFIPVWNGLIHSMRMEDLISNRERDLMLAPYPRSEVNGVQWPAVLLASEIPRALHMANNCDKEESKLFKKIKSDYYMRSAVTECYETLGEILCEVPEFTCAIDKIREQVQQCTKENKFLKEFKMSEMPRLFRKLDELHELLEKPDCSTDKSYDVLHDIMDIIIRDVMENGHVICQKNCRTTNNSNLRHKKPWVEKVSRLKLLLTANECAINVPMNLEARRRLTFFTNSLFRHMPKAPGVRDMLSFSVLTPYYNEDVLYSHKEFHEENEDGITLLYYLQNIYPDEWINFKQRIDDRNLSEEMEELESQWVSYRGQTLSRTVRGMMYYRLALQLQCLLESRNGFHVDQTLADLKFTYVVSCQAYGAQKKSKKARDKSCYESIMKLLLMYPSLRVAYIDEREEIVNEKPKKVYYSVLVKGEDKSDEEVYRIKLPGNPLIGCGKPENQNHAIIFTRGEALQTIDMNQDNYLEEAFKMRNVLEEFQRTKLGILESRHEQRGPRESCVQRIPKILGLREYIFTGSVSSLAWFMSNQETSFVTIGQRILAKPLRVRFHYGHPDIFDKIFHLTRGGISKASKPINLSEDIFSGFNSTLREGCITHHEYIQVGKGRDVGMNQISAFEAKVANGNGEQTLSRDVYRLGQQFDFYRMLSFYFTTVGFYFNSMVTVLTLYVFLYGHLFMVLSGLERAILENLSIHQSKNLEEALASQSLYQLGFLMVLPMVMETGLEKGFHTALGDFIIMQLQLASVFFTFQLGTKTHYYGRTILHGGSKYRSTGRRFVVFHAKFADNYRLYSRSHFVKGLELLILLLVYKIYGNSHSSSNLYWFITFSMWLLVGSWLLAPFVFNPSGFDWQKTVEDWKDWKRWMGSRCRIGIPPEKSWESWWDEEQGHLKKTSFWGRVLEIILAFRFLIYQYGIVYHLNIANHSKSVLVYVLSWVVMAIALLILKVESASRQRSAPDCQLMLRILKGLLFLVPIFVMPALFVICGLTVSDLLASILAFMPTGWALLLIAQACKSWFKALRLWGSVKELGRAYDYIMGLLIFTPIVILSWFPFISEFQTRMLFNQAFSRGLQISMILAGKKDKVFQQTSTTPPSNNTKDKAKPS